MYWYYTKVFTLWPAEVVMIREKPSWNSGYAYAYSLSINEAIVTAVIKTSKSKLTVDY